MNSDSNLKELFDKAENYIKSLEFENALVILEKILKIDPEYADNSNRKIS